MEKQSDKTREFSKEYGLLDAAGKKRYVEKLNLIGKDVDDPYCAKNPESNLSDILPVVEFGDLYHYLITAPSPVTREELKAWKSMDGRNYFVAGWVGKLRAFKVDSSGDKVVVLAKVRHSQAVSAEELEPWVAAEKSGSVICAHCTCKAGLGEACAHIAAILFTLVSHSEAVLQASCTSQPCQWLPPSLQPVEYKRVAEMDFTSPAKKLKHAATSASAESTPSTTKPAATSPTTSELGEFYKQLAEVGKPAVLSAVPGYSDAYASKRPPNVPPPLSDLYDESMLAASYVDMLEHCETIFASIFVSPEESKAIEEHTRKQSSSDLWFECRSGRITASKFKSAVRTDPHQPSESLVKGICYPQRFKFSTKATCWGCEHESTARNSYKEVQQKKHSALQISDSGLVVSTMYPFLGASPDGNVSCSCCGEGAIEVKCPYSCKDSHFKESAESPGFCLGRNADGGFFLKKDHQYFYQVQLQMFICNAKYCDFVVYSKKDLVILRILPESDFMESTISAATDFFKLAVLPELVGKYFSKTFKGPLTDSELDGDGGIPEATPCCGSSAADASPSKRVTCANEACAVKLFHLSCLKMKAVPKRKWYCPACRKARAQKKANKAKKTQL